MLKKYLKYSAERFPLPGVFLYAGSLYWMSYSFASSFNKAGAWSVSDFIMGFVVFFLVFLHLRIFDEHKDFQKDRIAYPERMLSRGEITLQDLRKILYPVLVLECILSIVLGIRVFAAWIMILIWTLLMLKEFFAPEFLNKRIGLYLISHQLLVPIMIAFPFMQRLNLLQAPKEALVVFTIFSLGTMCLTMTYEIARKTWSPDREKENADSYTKEWGIGRTYFASFIVAAIACAVFNSLLYKLGTLTPVLVNVALFILFLISETAFLITKDAKASKSVEYTGILYMLGTFIAVATAYTIH